MCAEIQSKVLLILSIKIDIQLQGRKNLNCTLRIVIWWMLRLQIQVLLSRKSTILLWRKRIRRSILLLNQNLLTTYKKFELDIVNLRNLFGNNLRNFQTYQQKNMWSLLMRSQNNWTVRQVKRKLWWIMKDMLTITPSMKSQSKSMISWLMQFMQSWQYLIDSCN